MSATSVPPPIAALDLPAGLRSLLRIQPDNNNSPYISITYANLTAYCNLHPTAPKNPIPRRRQANPKPTVNIDATIPTHLSHHAFDILPYIYLCTHYPHIDFLIHTSKSEYQSTFHSFLKKHVQKEVDAWAELLSQASMQQVRLYCRLERTVDIVLKPGSKMANELHCDVEPWKQECAASLLQREKLGLTGKNGQTWTGNIIVGTVEG
ncbi:hypothetical protein P3342_002429 [Pyrenophora teres f. teres]|nr:hypothetical protein PTNB85_02624 [Pyrenophora teres f. teres]KAE8866495.1 hypothetical protein PTNB29_03642 [Pyrenophora teres f. teres]KAK1920133.1 hypothetical protein P3342_002429 [Pyrenophora teres f. teres]